VFEFRVTKYDPAYRDPGGAFQRDEWASVSDLGRSFAGVLLGAAEYQRVEDAYIVVATALLRGAGVISLMASGLEVRTDRLPPLANGVILDLAAAGAVVRRMLPEKIWCCLESENGFVHVGYDY